MESWVSDDMRWGAECSIKAYRFLQGCDYVVDVAYEGSDKQVYAYIHQSRWPASCGPYVV